MTVTLRKGAGYFKPASYTLRFTKDGFEPSEMHLKGTVSGWYFGNIVFGGLIGMVAVDPATGAMYKLRPDTVEAGAPGREDHADRARIDDRRVRGRSAGGNSGAIDQNRDELNL
jgi:hypothetical protein